MRAMLCERKDSGSLVRGRKKFNWITPGSQRPSPRPIKGRRQCHVTAINQSEKRRAGAEVTLRTIVNFLKDVQCTEILFFFAAERNGGKH